MKKFTNYQRRLAEQAYQFCQRMARRYAYSNHGLYEDLLDEIVAMLPSAVYRYDGRGSAKFTTYFYKWAYGAIMAYFRKRSNESLLGEHIETIPSGDSETFWMK